MINRNAKMAELKIEAPLAKTEEWTDFSDFQNCEDVENSNKDSYLSPENNDNSFAANFTETFSTSLEDLVNTFDEKITKCFHNYDEKVEKIAPVQVRTQEEIMNECQMWWTITGNFGNILPIDWSKSYTRKLHINALNLNQKLQDQRQQQLQQAQLQSGGGQEEDNEDDEEEELAKDLDMHQLILSSLQQEPAFTAEQVLQEIDQIMQQQDSPSSEAGNSDISCEKTPDGESKVKSTITSLLYESKLQTLTVCQLNELYLELERMIQDHSETLIQELARRDELEFEKELKNSFISLLLSVQNKRRQQTMEKKKTRGPNGLEPKYLTTVIPYSLELGPADNQTLQVLIKILQAINEDSPTVPTLLTDYILKVLCPT